MLYEISSGRNRFIRKLLHVRKCTLLVCLVAVAIFVCGMLKWSFWKSHQFDNGLISRNIEKERRLASFLLRPFKVENIVTQGACTWKADSIAWGMITMVKSSVTNYERRKVIRSTWGEIKGIKNVLSLVVFIVGNSEDARTVTQVNQESVKYGDILMYDQMETARNVPEKILAGMQWFDETIKYRNWFYSSADDDVVVHVPHLVTYLSFLIETRHELPIVCIYSFQKWDKPAREPSSKWFISETEYPGWYWPEYCRGGFYTMSSSLNQRIFRVSRRTSKLYLDDVWITGLMRRKLGEGDGNIIAAPLSKRLDGELIENKHSDIKEVLVHHVWGNIAEKVVDVPLELKNIWQNWRSDFTNEKTFCKYSDL